MIQNATLPETATFSGVKLGLHAEALVILLAAIALYAHLGGGAVLFIALLLVPDVSALGYLVNKKVGALTYNIAHTYASPILFGLFGMATSAEAVQWLALIWMAHIAMDRTVGYGLKYATDFKQTHLGRV